MVQEEINQKTIALAFKAERLTVDALKTVVKMYLNRPKTKAPAHGKMSVKQLVGQGQGANTIEISSKSIKDFERIARKYNVDFAIKKDKTQAPPKYLAVFKARDTDIISMAFKEFVKANEKKQTKVSLREKLGKLIKQVAQNKDKELFREKQKDRGASL